MSSKALDPNLASILESIRATIGTGEAPGPGGGQGVEADADEPAAASPRERNRAAVRNAREAFAKSRTVEEFLADLARPYVQTWLADHLPEMVQKMVAEEIGRLTGRNGS